MAVPTPGLRGRGARDRRPYDYGLASKPHPVCHSRVRKFRRWAVRRRMPERQGAPFLAQTTNPFRPFRQGVAGLSPLRHARLVRPFSQARRRLSMRAAGAVGAQGQFVAPDGHGPEGKLGVALHGSRHKALRFADLRYRPVRVQQKERQESQRPEPKARNADQARDNVRLASLRRFHSVTTSLLADTPRRCCSSAAGICANPAPSRPSRRLFLPA